MRAVAVRSSELSQYNRMDAGFFVALNGVRRRYEELVATISADEATRLLKAMPRGAREAARVLARGTNRSSTESLRSAIREYPHLSLALAEMRLPEVIEGIRERIRVDQRNLDTLVAFMNSRTAASVPDEPDDDASEDFTDDPTP